MPVPQTTPSRKLMLEFIAHYHTVTTRQIHYWVQPDKHETQTNRDLNMLKKLKMVRSYPLQLKAQGGRSSLCWQLLRAGAAHLQLEYYGSHYTRKPTGEALEQLDYELEMLNQLRVAGFKWLEPQAYNSQHQKPAQTPQSAYLRKYLGAVESRKLSELQRLAPNHPQLASQLLDYKAGMYLVRIPDQTNDYVFYLEKELLAFVVIPCPFDASENFWKARLKQYRKATKDLVIVAAFRNEEQANLAKVRLKQAGIRSVRFNRVGSLARSLSSEATPTTAVS